MIKEYRFAELIYDEETGRIGCGACGKPIDERKVIFKVAGRWVCGKCLRGFEAGATAQCAMCSTVKAAVER